MTGTSVAIKLQVYGRTFAPSPVKDLHRVSETELALIGIPCS